MSGNVDKSQAASERIKAQALSAAKGLSRAQAERAAAAATRNVNAYGQKEEGPSRWQERKEAKRQMYLQSTEKAVILGVKPKALPTSSGGAYFQCQKCFQPGHWTYECKNDRVYMSRPSRTQQLKNPNLKKMTVPVSYHFENPDLEKEREEERKLKNKKSEKEKSRSKGKSKRKHRSRSDSDSSEASVFDSDTESSVTGSEYSSESGGSSSYSSSDSEDKKRDKKRQHKRKQKKRRHRRHSTSSASSESESESVSDTDSDDKGSQRKSKKRADRR